MSKVECTNTTQVKGIKVLYVSYLEASTTNHKPDKLTGFAFAELIDNALGATADNVEGRFIKLSVVSSA